MKDFKISKAIEEITIDEKPYQLDLSDKKKARYAEIGQELTDTAKEVQSIKTEDIEELKKHIDLLKNKSRSAMDEILGDGSFDEIYEKSNESLENTLDVLFDVIAYIDERYKERFKKKKAKYSKKKR